MDATSSRIGRHLIGEAYEVRVFFRWANTVREPGWFWSAGDYLHGPFDTSEAAYRHALAVLG